MRFLGEINTKFNMGNKKYFGKGKANTNNVHPLPLWAPKTICSRPNQMRNTDDLPPDWKRASMKPPSTFDVSVEELMPKDKREFSDATSNIFFFLSIFVKESN